MNNMLKRGLLVGGVQTLWLFGGFTLLKALPLNMPLPALRGLVGLFSLVILFTGVFYGIKKERDTSGDAEFTYQRALVTGLIISVIVALMVSLFSVIYLTLLNPGFVGEMVRETEDALRASGATADEIASKTESIRAQSSLGIQVMMSLVLQAGMGTIFSLVLAIFLKREKE